MKLSTNISIGELLDKVTILMIKKEKISDKEKLKDIEKELVILQEICDSKLEGHEKWIDKLKPVNEEIWGLIGQQWKNERDKVFDDQLIELARKVYLTNDLRFKIKHEINDFYGSEIKEQKSYEDL